MPDTQHLFQLEIDFFLILNNSEIGIFGAEIRKELTKSKGFQEEKRHYFLFVIQIKVSWTLL